MSKIAIISRPDQGVLIDVSGCSNRQEAVEQLTSTLQVSSQFWSGLAVNLNFGNLQLASSDLNHLLAIAKGLGVSPKEVFAHNEDTIKALTELGIKVGSDMPAALFSNNQSISLPVSLTDSATCEITSVIIEEETAQKEIDTTGSRIVMYEQSSDIKEDGSDNNSDLPEEAQSLPPTLNDSVLYLRQTLRSGQAISHEGHLVIIGDVNAGAEVRAHGDITIWGSLRGVAHAGIGGNQQAEIRALKFEPIQIRIADSIARSPDSPMVGQLASGSPESARLIEGKIRILRNALE